MGLSDLLGAVKERLSLSEGRVHSLEGMTPCVMGSSHEKDLEK